MSEDNRVRLVIALTEISDEQRSCEERNHRPDYDKDRMKATSLLLEYIGDREISEMVDSIVNP